MLGRREVGQNVLERSASWLGAGDPGGRSEAAAHVRGDIDKLLTLVGPHFLHLLFREVGDGLQGGFQTPFKCLPREMLDGALLQKAELLDGGGDCSPQPHPPSISSPTPPRHPLGTLEEPLGTMEHSLKTVGSDLKGLLPAFGLEESMPVEVKSQGLPLALSGELDSILGWGGGVISAGRRQPMATTTRTILLPLKFLEQLAGRHECA